MASRTSTGLLLPVIVVVALLAVFGGSKVVSTIGGMFSGHDPVMVGDHDHQLLVGSDGESKVKPCPAEQTLASRRCGDLKVVIIDAAKMAFIARNIKLAWASGQPALLHRESTGASAKRTKVCGASVFKKTYPRGSCDEYSFASSREGGEGARTEQVHEDEQNCQGGTISWAYQNLPINEGDAYLVVISHPDKIAGQVWAGQEVRVSECLG